MNGAPLCPDFNPLEVHGVQEPNKTQKMQKLGIKKLFVKYYLCSLSKGFMNIEWLRQ